VLGHHLVSAARGGAHLRARVVNKNQTDNAMGPNEEHDRSARRRETLSGLNAHGCTIAGCTGSQSCFVRQATLSTAPQPDSLRAT